jgi:RNA-directed DNA polymerase
MRSKSGAGEERESPDTFNFLGFTHSCGKTRKGKFMVLRQTMRRRWQAKLKEIKEALRQRRHQTIPEMGRYLRSVVAGHMRYYAVPMNAVSVSNFRLAVSWIWWRVLKRRSQRTHLPWNRMKRHVARWLPQVRICHPYPWERFGVAT